jgi:hypothetical protein
MASQGAQDGTLHGPDPDSGGTCEAMLDTSNNFKDIVDTVDNSIDIVVVDTVDVSIDDESSTHDEDDDAHVDKQGEVEEEDDDREDQETHDCIEGTENVAEAPKTEEEIQELKLKKKEVHWVTQCYITLLKSRSFTHTMLYCFVCSVESRRRIGI